MRPPEASGLLFPAGLGLLPVGQDVPARLGMAPTLARRLDRGGVVAVEQIGAAGEGAEILGGDAIDQDQHRGAVWVLGLVAEPDRLGRGIAIAGRAVRQKARLIVGP